MDPAQAPEEMAGLLEALQGLDHMASAGGAQMAGGAVAPAGGEGEEITPEPAFVVKTRDDNGRKVFINVLGSPAIGAPGGWEGGRVPDHVEEALRRQEAAPDESLRFPLSLSEPQNDLDRKGEPCTVFDCAFNADVVQQAVAHRRLQVFLVELAMGWTCSKHDLELDPKFKLPRMKYKGEKVQTHLIRKDPKRVVQEVQEVEEEPTFPLVTKKLPATVKNRPKAERGEPTEGSSGVGEGARESGPQASQVAVEYEGRPVERVRISVSWGTGEGRGGSESVQVEDVAVAVTGETLEVRAKGVRDVDVPLPFAVDAGAAVCELRPGGRALDVILPYRPLSSVVQEMRETAPHRFGSLDFTNKSFLELE